MALLGTPKTVDVSRRLKEPAEDVPKLAAFLPGAGAVEMRKLILSGNPHLTDGMWAAIFDGLQVHQGALETLLLNDCALGGLAVDKLATYIQNYSPSLHTLGLEKNPAQSTQEWGRLFCALEHRALHKLSIGHNTLTDVTMPMLARAIKADTFHLQVLDLAETKTPQSLKVLFDAVASSSSLQVLSLAHCSFGSGENPVDAMGALAACLEHNTALKELSLSGCQQIPVAGWNLLFDAAAKSKAPLQYINTGHCCLVPEVVPSFAAFIATSTTLATINLQGCGQDFTDKEWTVIFDALVRTTAPIRALLLKGCLYDHAACDVLAAFVAHSRHLEVLEAGVRPYRRTPHMAVYQDPTYYDALFAALRTTAAPVHTLSLAPQVCTPDHALTVLASVLPHTGIRSLEMYTGEDFELEEWLPVVNTPGLCTARKIQAVSGYKSNASDIRKFLEKEYDAETYVPLWQPSAAQLLAAFMALGPARRILDLEAFVQHVVPKCTMEACDPVLEAMPVPQRRLLLTARGAWA